MARSLPLFRFSGRSLATIALCASACSSSSNPQEFAKGRALSETALAAAPDGLSGLAADAQGKLWAVAEAASALVHVDSKQGVGLSVPIAGIREEIELESVAFLANGDLVLGTESEASDRASDAILFASRDDSNQITVRRELALDYKMWGLTAPSDQGIEGLCIAGDSLVVVVEAVIKNDGERFAPLAVYDLRMKAWQPYRLKLTSKVGKIAGLACRLTKRGLEFVAIERHYPVRLVVHGVIDPGAAKKPIVPAIAVDLSARPDNLEGIAWLADGSVAMVSDNFFGGRRWGHGKLIVAEMTYR